MSGDSLGPVRATAPVTPPVGPVRPQAAPAQAPPAPPAPPAEKPAPAEVIRFNNFANFDLFDPTQGVSFDLRARASLNVPATQVINDAQAPKSENPLNNPLIRDYRGGVDVGTNLRMNRSNWFFGIAGDVQAAASTQGIDRNKGAFAQVYDQAEALKKDFSGLQKTVQGLQNQLLNDPAIQQAQTLIGQLQSNPNNPQALQQLRGLLQSGAIQRSLDGINNAIGQTNATLGKAQDALNTLGDGTRSLLADATVQGALEMQAGYRSDPISLGNGWNARLGVAGSVILPLPNYGQNAGIPGLSEFKYAMVKTQAEAQLVTSGLGQLAGDLGNLQQNLGNLQTTLQSTRDQVDQATQLANSNNPNLAQAAALATSIQQSATQAAQTAQNLAGNLQSIQQSVAAVNVQPSLSLTTVTPTSPFGIGIRQAGASFQGPIAPWLHARADFNVYNPVGVLPGVENRYRLNLNQSGNLMDSLLPANSVPGQPNRGGQDLNPDLQQVSSTERNVFHDFYRPAIGTQLGLRAFPDRWFSPEIQAGLRQGLDGGAPGAEINYTQHLGPINLTSGVLMPDVSDMSQNFYQAQIGVGEVFALGAGTQSFSELRGLSTNLSVNIPGQNLYFKGMLAPTEAPDGRAQIQGGAVLGGSF